MSYFVLWLVDWYRRLRPGCILAFCGVLLACSKSDWSQTYGHFSWNCLRIDCWCWSFVTWRFLHWNSCTNQSSKFVCLRLSWSFAFGPWGSWSRQSSALLASGLARRSEAGTGPREMTQDRKWPRPILIEESIKYLWARPHRTGAIFFY